MAKKKQLGAFDKNGDWWNAEEIRVFTAGMIEMCFGIPKHQIKIIQKP